jgi:protein O-GlcNAc transferase
MPEITIQNTLDQAMQYHHAGRLSEAAAIYRQILATHPNQADAWHLLGVIAHQSGKDQDAFQWISRAIKINPTAEICHNSLGVTLMALGRRDQAISAYRNAIRIKPDYAEAHNNLGNALKAQGQFDAAAAAYQTALKFKRDYAEAHNNLGMALIQLGKYAQAAEACRAALKIKPDYKEAHNNLGVALMVQGLHQQAVEEYRHALKLSPDDADIHNNLGQVLAQEGQLDAAVVEYREALRLNPNLAVAHNNLGNALRGRRQLSEAIAACRTAVQLNPGYVDAWDSLGIALQEAGRPEESIAAYQTALRLNPAAARVHNNLANVLKDVGRIDLALGAYRKALQLAPEMAQIHSNLIYTMHQHPDFTAQAIHEELLRWNQQHAAGLKKLIKPPLNDRDSERKLRIGYVSPDFAEHVVGWNLLPLFEKHNHELFEIFCYSGVQNPDSMTGRLHSLTHGWRNIVGASDQQAAQMVRDDRIDILVDLSLHTAGNRLPIFALKPAPVQATWLGYCSSTGLDAIDFRLSDPYLDPPDADLTVYSEQTIRLPHSYWCYHAGPAPEPAPPPVLSAGFITFGCLNNFHKISPAAQDLWVQILKAVPNSRLIIRANSGSHLQDVVRRFAGVDRAADRIEFVGMQPWEQYINTYARIDIALDPFPYGGGITTCDSLWMGVPVVSLSGKTAVGRAGRSILTNIGLPELIAKTPEQYVQIAVLLALDQSRLAELRSSLRHRMQASPLTDAESFARDIEAAYREMWRKWVQTKSNEN